MLIYTFVEVKGEKKTKKTSLTSLGPTGWPQHDSHLRRVKSRNWISFPGGGMEGWIFQVFFTEMLILGLFPLPVIVSNEGL